MKDNNTPLVSVIVPVFNEEESIGATLERTLQLRKKYNLEVVVVDDGSTDRTRGIIRTFADVLLISHTRNLGKGMAIITGMVKSRGDILVVQDADLEYLPEEIPRLIEPILNKKADVVFGSRFSGRIVGMGRTHWFGNKLLSATAGLLYGVQITDVMTGHKAFSRKSLNSIKLREKDFEIEVEFTAKLLRNGWRIAEVPISYSFRRNGRSKIGYRDGFRCFIKLLVLRVSAIANNENTDS